MKERSPEPSGWLLARHFPNASHAIEAYEAARDLILIEDLEASAFRFTLNGESHVALVGEPPLSREARRKVEAALSRGREAGELPSWLLGELRRRRKEFKGLGVEFLERRGAQPPIRHPNE